MEESVNSSKVLSIFDPLSSTSGDAPLGEEGEEKVDRARSGEKEGSTTTVDRRADVLSTFDPLTSTEKDVNSSAASAIDDHSQSKLISDVKGLSIQSGEPVKPVYSQAGQTLTVTATEESTPLPSEDQTINVHQVTGTSSSLDTIAEDPPTGDLLSMGAHSATSASVVSPPAPPNKELPWQPNVDQPGYVMGGGGRGGTNLPRKAKRKSSRSSATKSSPKKTSANFPAVSPSTVSGASHVTSADVAMATTVGSSAPVMGDHMMSSMKIQSEMLQIDSILKALNTGKFDSANMETINSLTSSSHLLGEAEQAPRPVSMGLDLINQLGRSDEDSSSSDSDYSSSEEGSSDEVQG